MGENEDVGIVILAAGASTRFGSPKQLAQFEGKTLIRRASETAISTGLKTIVVLGAIAEKVREEIKDLPLEVFINESWKNGMSSSIVSGLKELLKANPKLSAVIVLLCDQPFIGKETILKLIETQRLTSKPIVASEYENTVGVPALFAKNVFDELLNLNEKNGAKRLIKKCDETDVALISVPKARFDIDTENDLKRLKKLM